MKSKKSTLKQTKQPVKLKKTDKVGPKKSAKVQKAKSLVKPSKGAFVRLKNVPQKVDVKEVTIKRKRFIMPSKNITDDIVTKCLGALEKLTEHQKKSNRIFDDETPVFAEIRCIKIQKKIGNIKFVYPHSTAASTGEVCLITPDLKKGRKIDHEPTVDHWQELLRKADVKSIKTVIPMRQLRVEYDQFELKRRLLTQHDFIMVDTRVLNHVSHILGEMFFKKHNMIIPVKINEKDLKKSVDTGLRTAILRLNIGETSTIIVGHTGMSQSHLKDNVLSLVKQINERYPGGELNIRSISLKLPLSLSLPIYITLRPSNVVNSPKIVKKRPKNYMVVEDELSTIPGSRVAVAPDGTVRFTKRGKPNYDSDMEDDVEINKEEESEDEIN